MDYYEEGLEHLSKLQDLMDMHDYLEDDNWAHAQELALKCIANPNISAATARKALLQMQAYSMYFKNLGNYYMLLKKGRAGTAENTKKNAFLSMAGECHEMAQTLKYLAKEQFGA